jgi:hypothetical protein
MGVEGTMMKDDAIKDEALEKVIDAIPQQQQRQYGSLDQLQYLRTVANKLGLYDAADRIGELTGFGHRTKH